MWSRLEQRLAAHRSASASDALPSDAPTSAGNATTVISKLLTELFSRFFFRHQRKKRKKLHQHKKKMKQSWQPKCTSSSPHLLSFSHPQLELASVSPSLSLTLSLSFSLLLSLPLSPLCYSLSFLSLYLANFPRNYSHFFFFTKEKKTEKKRYQNKKK